MPDTWQRYRLSWRLASPLHIGHRTIGTIARTRLWVPGRNLWGALIDALGTHANGEYARIQDQLKEGLRFEAAFLGSSASDIWSPEWKTDQGLCYGSLTETQLQRLVLGANVGTAIDHGPTIAEEGMLFETEYIAPQILHGEQKRKPLWLVGHLWLKQGQEQLLMAAAQLVPTLKEMRVGGEQKSGYGRLVDGTITPFPDERYTMNADEHLTIQANAPFPLLVAANDVRAERGQVEPIVGRSTIASHRHGAKLEAAQLCWLPGSVFKEEQTLLMNAETPGIAGIKT